MYNIVTYLCSVNIIVYNIVVIYIYYVLMCKQDLYLSTSSDILEAF